MLCVDMVVNVVYLWQLILSVFFVDQVIERSHQMNHLWRVAMLIGMGHALPMFLVKQLKEQEAWFGVGGAARKVLQVDILRKYLQLTERSRSRIGAAGFIEALYRDSFEVVDHGYMQLIAAAAAGGKIIFILLFTAATTPYALPLQLGLPIFMLHRMYTREPSATMLRLRAFRAQNRMLGHADDVTKNYQTIRDSNLKPVMATRMENIIVDLNYFTNAITAHTARSKLALPVASACIAGLMMAVAPFVIANIGLSSGNFLATLAATTQMGTELEKFFEALGHIQLSISALLKVFGFLNQETDSSGVMLASQKQQERGRKVAEDSSLQDKSRARDPKWLKKLGLDDVQSNRKPRVQGLAIGDHSCKAGGGLAEITGKGEGEEPLADEKEEEHDRSADDLLIEMLSVAVRPDGEEVNPFDEKAKRVSQHFSVDVMDEFDENQELLNGPITTEAQALAMLPRTVALQNISLQLRQGKVYAVVGAHGSGKSHFLRVLGKAVHPTHGEVFVPPHLSIRHVEQTPQLFRNLTLYENLVVRLGREQWPSVEAVCNVCGALGLAPHWLDYLRVTGLPKQTAEGTEGAGQQIERPHDADLATHVQSDSSAGHKAMDVQPWEAQLSASDREIIHLAAAIIANPHLLILHRPTVAFEAALTWRVLEAIRKFVDDRGSSEVLYGHPGQFARTVLFTCNVDDLQALSIVDGVIVMGLPTGGATLFHASQMLNGTESNESRAAALSRQLVSLLPMSQHHQTSVSFQEAHATDARGSAHDAWSRVSHRTSALTAFNSCRSAGSSADVPNLAEPLPTPTRGRPHFPKFSKGSASKTAASHSSGSSAMV
mmetsp:Transcript_36218/g.72015  ORF Transcript_36218/g.72015 Transcript_36218/m.72015 type:complete len:832 (-) Transcript_36218:455-2950(-)